MSQRQQYLEQQTTGMLQHGNILSRRGDRTGHAVTFRAAEGIAFNRRFVDNHDTAQQLIMKRLVFKNNTINAPQETSIDDSVVLGRAPRS